MYYEKNLVMSVLHKQVGDGFHDHPCSVHLEQERKRENVILLINAPCMHHDSLTFLP